MDAISQRLKGQLTHIIYRNEENGYTVARFQPVDGGKQTVVVGSLLGVEKGEKLICQGYWVNSKRHGKQFQVEQFEQQLPSSPEDIERYLSSGQIRGIGPAFAKRIVDHFGKNTLDIIENSPEELLEVRGISQNKLDLIISSWQEQQKARSLIIFLQQNGISPAFAQKIYRKYGSESIAKIKQNPYCLANDIEGIGFKKADEMAQKMGLQQEDPKRVSAALLYLLQELAGQGHSCYPLQSFLQEGGQMLALGQEQLQGPLAQLKENKAVFIERFWDEGKGQDERLIWSKSLYYQEKDIIDQLDRLNKHPQTWAADIDIEAELELAQKNTAIELATEQLEAVRRSLSQKLHIITGGPGTGKSTITKVILNILSRHSDNIFLAAPTGRAAKRLAEVTGKEASTIHSLLSISIGGYYAQHIRNMEQLDCDVLIVDEASMIDTTLMAILLYALPNHCKLILVGDVDQLPSVGPGNVLDDLMGSDKLEVTRLKEIFRQAANSKIVRNAHKINQGIFPDIQTEADADFFFIPKSDAADAAQMIPELMAKRLPKRYNFDAKKDIQLLCPIHKGDLGTRSLNKSLQKALNPSGPKKDKIERGEQVFYLGDKVMQLKNDYEKGVYNGDIGYIRKISPMEKTFIVEMDGKVMIEYQYQDLQNMDLAYAVSVHKYQGSEAPCIVMPVHESQYSLLFRNLIYTAITRGKRLVVLIGSKKALQIAVRNQRMRKRYSGLLWLLQDPSEKKLPSIQIAPLPNSPEYPDWLERHFPDEV